MERNLYTTLHATAADGQEPTGILAHAITVERETRCSSPVDFTLAGPVVSLLRLASPRTHRVRLGIAIVGAVTAAFGIGVRIGREQQRAHETWADAALLSMAMDSVRIHALDSLPSDELIRRAVAGMVRELRDPYAALLLPESAKRYRGSLQGEGQGMGLTLRHGGNEATITRVATGSPAAEAGLHPGDRILAVDGISVRHGWGAERDSLASPPTRHQVTARRAPFGDTVQVTLQRRPWRAAAISDAVLLHDSLGYVRLATMSARSAAALEDSVAALLDRGAKRLVLDLRGNTGGLFEEGVQAAGLFLPEQTLIASLAGRGGAPAQQFRGRRARFTDLPLAVLVDANTASSAEVIVATFLEHRRAVVIGEPTYGKGVVQRVLTLSPTLSLRLTTARWLTPSGQVLARRVGQGRVIRGGLHPQIRIDTIADSVRQLWTGRRLTPSWSLAQRQQLTRQADSLAWASRRDGWASLPLGLLESRLRTTALTLAPRPLRRRANTRAAWAEALGRHTMTRILEGMGERTPLLRHLFAEDLAVAAARRHLEPASVHSSAPIVAERPR